MTKFFWKIYWKLAGWSIGGHFPSSLRKCIIIVGPHTSAWDIVVGMAARAVVPIRNAHFLGKKELFSGPFAWFFRWCGGVPVDRSGHLHMVDQVVSLFNEQDAFILAMSPEGTRKKVERIRTGFYYIAKKAGVPLIMAGMDFADRKLIFSDPFYPGQDEAADFARIIKFFSGIRGKHPELGMQHLLQS